MCGILGILSYKNDFEDYRLHLSLNQLKHRGPDGFGIYQGKFIHMGMRRLSIIDLNTGNQPIYNENKTIACIFNGEIYNFIELREELSNKGHEFYTHSDTEVIVHAYEEYGLNFASKLNGMFAIALWDSNINKLYIARDRLGEKPLYFAQDNQNFGFSSEIKPLFSLLGLKPEPNLQAIDQLLSFNYILYPLTSFKGIKRLEPGSIMEISDEKIVHHKFWQIKNNATQSEIDYSYLDSLVYDSTKIRLRSDVEVGTLLSGGIDSSLITTYTSKILPHQFKTFSIGFKEPQFDESQYSLLVSSKFKTDHTLQIFEQENFLEDLVNAIWFSENPHGDVSFIPTYKVSKLASQKLKVVLTGDGGDEIFGGYEKYIDFKYDSHESIDDNFSRYLENNFVFNAQEKHDLFLNQHFPYQNNTQNFFVDEYKTIFPTDFINKILHFDTNYLLEGNNLVKPDRMGMANSIEARYPLLDYRIVDYLFDFHSSQKISNITKIPLKKLLASTFNEDFINRKKQMFTVPIGEWFKGPIFIDLFRKIINSKSFTERAIFNHDYLNKMISYHASGFQNNTRKIRLILIIELWFRIFIDEKFDNVPKIKDIVKELSGIV
jgi:asparagine synthase (glutamine-hydrolysing)